MTQRVKDGIFGALALACVLALFEVWSLHGRITAVEAQASAAVAWINNVVAQTQQQQAAQQPKPPTTPTKGEVK